MVRLLCCFVPGRNNRHKIREYFSDNTNNLILNKLTGVIDETHNIKQDIIVKTDAIKEHEFILRHEIELFINRNIQKQISTALLHQKTFTKFKAIHTGQDIVILATGPSLNNFKPIKNAIYIGVNSAFKYDKVKLDYLFAQDYSGMHGYIDAMDEYKGNNCVKFYGITTEYNGGYERVIPEQHAIRANALRYRTDWESVHGPFECKFAYDISVMPLGCFGSIVFPAIQFALWTNPKRIFLVGCDCSNAGHFDKTGGNNLEPLVDAYKIIKYFASVYYPDTEIISVNPVGLRGLFQDLDQK